MPLLSYRSFLYINLYRAGPNRLPPLLDACKEQKGLIQGEDLDQDQDTDEPVKKRGGYGAQQPNITVDGMKMVAEVKTTNKKTDKQGEMCPTLCFSMYICRSEEHTSELQSL